MDKNYLLETAEHLKQVSEESANEYNNKTEQLLAKMNSLMLKRPDLDCLIGANNIEMMKDNHSNHLRFIGSILKNRNINVLVDTILWVFRAYRSHHFSTNYWAAQLNNWIAVLKNELSQECFEEVFPYYEWMQINIPAFVIISDEKLEATYSLH